MSIESQQFGGDAESEQIKKDLNTEGWEGNAAVHVGTREELDQARERLEKGEHYADLGTFIRMNKEIVLSRDDPELAGVLDQKGTEPGSYFVEWPYLYFFDKDKQLARVNIRDTDSKVRTMEGKDPAPEQSEILALGFHVVNLDYNTILFFAQEKRKRLEQAARQKKESGFDF